MREMLANRYLLNGKAAEALELYRAALRSDPHQPDLQCRLILAQLQMAQLDDVARFVLGVLDEQGPEGLARLRQGCKGFVPSDAPRDQPGLIGLRALLDGELDRAREHLQAVSAERYPAVAALAARLEELEALDAR